MFANTTRSITALLLFALPACARENPARLRDTTGATFALVCEDDRCKLVPEQGTPPPATCNDASVFYGYFVGRFVEICAAQLLDDRGAWGTDASLCRLAACEQDDECPLLLGREYACQSGLCQRVDKPTDELSMGDIVELCFDAEPRPQDCHAQQQDPEVRAVFDLARASCPNDVCSLPASCRKP